MCIISDLYLVVSVYWFIFHVSLSCQESDDSDVEVEVDEEDNENHVRGVQTKSVSAAGGWRRKVGLGVSLFLFFVFLQWIIWISEVWSMTKVGASVAWNGAS